MERHQTLLQGVEGGPGPFVPRIQSQRARECGAGFGRVAEREARLVRGGAWLEARGAVVLAEVALRRSRPGDALAILNVAKTSTASGGLTSPRNLEFLRGDALARSTRLSEAATAFREEIHACPTNAQAYARLAVVLALQHRTRVEIAALLESMYRANPSPATAELAAKTLESVGDHAGVARWAGRVRSTSVPLTTTR